MAVAAKPLGNAQIYATLSKHFGHPVDAAWLQGKFHHPVDNAWLNGIVHGMTIAPAPKPATGFTPGGKVLPGGDPTKMDPHGGAPGPHTGEGPAGTPGAPGAPGTVGPVPPTQTAPGQTAADLNADLQKRNASVLLNDLFKSYGLESLAPKILGYIQSGYDAPTTNLLLQETPEFKQRFAGNELRRQAGLAVLSPAEYLATERAYKNTAAAFNLPKGFYDTPADFTQMIGKDISPNEFQARASHAFQYAQSTDPAARSLLQSYYGVDSTHIAAYFLDPARAQASLDKASSVVDLGAAGLRQGIGVSKGLAQSYVDQGVTQQQADSGFANASQVLNAGQLGIAQRFGSDLSATDVSNEFVANLASARRKRDVLNQSETALFAGNADTAVRSFAQDNLGSF